MCVKIDFCSCSPPPVPTAGAKKKSGFSEHPVCFFFRSICAIIITIIAHGRRPTSHIFFGVGGGGEEAKVNSLYQDRGKGVGEKILPNVLGRFNRKVVVERRGRRKEKVEGRRDKLIRNSPPSPD